MKAFIAGCLMIASISSCTIVRKYPKQKPFVYETKISLIGNFTKAEKTNLEEALRGQLDDSLRARRLDKLLWQVLKHPAAYDSTAVDKSVIFMKGLLVSLGYFDDSIAYGHKIDTVGKDQFRTTINFDVAPRRLWRLDTVVYNMRVPELQRLVDTSKRAALVKPGDAFAKAPISAEIDRLTELFRNNGYLKFSRDELIGVWDTLDVSLLQPTLDPFEQLRILQQLRQRKQTPTAKLEIRLRTVDSTKLTKYYNGNVIIYPDYSIEVDTAHLKKRVDVDSAHHITVIQWRNKFKAKIFPPNVYLPHDSLYRLRRFIRTVNRLNSLGAWRLVNIDQIPRRENDTVDYVARLTAAKKFSYTTTLKEVLTRLHIRNAIWGRYKLWNSRQNFKKAANFDAWNARYGVEFVVVEAVH
jgi:outer membrane protein assembly factor BamA